MHKNIKKNTKNDTFANLTIVLKKENSKYNVLELSLKWKSEI